MASNYYTGKTTEHSSLPLGWRLLLSIVFFVFSSHLLSALFLPWNRVDITLESEHEQIIRVYHDNGIGKEPFNERFSYRSRIVLPEGKQTVSIGHPPRTLAAIRIDPGNSAGITKIYKITYHNVIAGRKTFKPEQIHDNFVPNSHIATYTLEPDHVRIVSTGDDPSLTGALITPPIYTFYRYLLTALFTLIFFLLSSDISSAFMTRWRRLPAYTDIDSKGPAEGQNYQPLDGLRGIGAIYVLAEHATVRFDGLGGLGVCIFFTLSGFLLMQPFLKNSSRILNGPYMADFYRRRIKRILPMYSFYLFIVYFISARFDTFFRHLFFLQGDKHLWTMPQEMFFYMLIPIILITFHLLKKIHIYAAAASFIPLIWFVNMGIFEVNIIHNDIYPMDIARNISIFLCGMAIAIVVKGVMKNIHFTSTLRKTFGIAGIIIFCFFTLLSMGLFNTKIYALSYPFSFNLLASGLIICAMLGQGTLFTKILSSRILRGIGLVSFSFYIVHYIIIQLIKKSSLLYMGTVPNEYIVMILAGVISYCVSVLSYSYIEKPFLTHKPSKKQAYRETR